MEFGALKDCPLPSLRDTFPRRGQDSPGHLFLLAPFGSKYAAGGNGGHVKRSLTG